MNKPIFFYIGPGGGDLPSPTPSTFMAGCLPPPFKFCMLHILVHNLAAYMHHLPHSTESMLLASYILDCAFSLTSLPNNCIYGGTSLLRTPSGPHEASLIKEVSLFQRLFCALLYVAGTTGSVLIKEVSLIRRSLLNREVPQYLRASGTC